MIIVLKRFYVLTQYAIPDKFYTDPDYCTFFSESEAINLVASMFNTQYVDLLLDFAKTYKNPDDFYNWIIKNIPELYTFPQGKYEFFNILDRDKIIEVRPVDNTKNPEYEQGDTYVDKGNFNFHGFKIYPTEIDYQIFPPADETSTTGTKTAATPNPTVYNPIQTFIKNKTRTNWKQKWGGAIIEDYLKFANENVILIKDIEPILGGISTNTRFLIRPLYIGVKKNDMLYVINKNQGEYMNTWNRADFIDIINKNNNGKPNGNTAFQKIKPPVPINLNTAGLKESSDIVSIWVDQLSKHDDEIYDSIIDVKGTYYDPRLSAIVLLSSFGYALSPFNIYLNSLNELFFNLPAAIEVPSYLPCYMGALAGIDNTMTDPNYKRLYDFFVTGPGKTLDSSGVLIFADIADINNQLATADKELVKPYYDAFIKGPYDDIRGQLYNLYYDVKKNPEVINAKNPEDKIAAKKVIYEKQLSANISDSYFNFILQPLMIKQNIINYSQITFKRDASTNALYKGLSITNKTNKTINDNYFRAFFSNLSAKIVEKKKQLLLQKNEDEKSTGDEDIITQTYYSFKNINDKWLTGPQRNESKGYPAFEGKMGNKLIDSFVFVDRAMNPIGDTIINPKILTDMLEDQDISIYSVLSQLLSLNGFEFFPLQNFMKFEKPMEWQESFMIDPIGSSIQAPAFVCMYIGGGSSYPSGIQAFGQFKDDGVTDLLSGIPDFKSSGDCDIDREKDKQVQINDVKPNDSKFPFKQVRAFRVKFGEQNQSMFTNIKIESKEYPDTNESIQILSRLAGDDKLQAPTPKGQNLYNLYENRAYRATVTGLGNAMIQPTQYFQVENVPLYNGAYLVLSVEHNIEPNKMTTTFSGTKILKYPIPRVVEPSALMGYEGGSTDNTNSAESSANGVVVGESAGGETKSQYNSMYEFKIR
jgi:hypothetical protein